MTERTYRSTILTALLLAAPALSGQAFGQEPLRPTDPLAPSGSGGGNGNAQPDIGGWLGEEPLPGAAPAPVGPAPTEGAAAGGDPLAGPAAEPAPVDPEEAKKEQRRRDRAIDKNYSSAIEIYEGMDDPTHNITALDRRIANNERLIADYKRRIAESTRTRRAMQVDLFNRTFFLRQQRERNQITQESFDKLIRQEERKYEEESASTKMNLEAWHRELKEAEERLVSLKSERRMHEASMPRATRRGRGGQAANGPVPAPKPGERLIGTLEERLRQLDHFNTRSTMDGVHPRDVGVGTVESTELEPEEEE